MNTTETMTSPVPEPAENPRTTVPLRPVDRDLLLPGGQALWDAGWKLTDADFVRSIAGLGGMLHWRSQPDGTRFTFWWAHLTGVDLSGQDGTPEAHLEKARKSWLSHGVGEVPSRLFLSVGLRDFLDGSVPVASLVRVLSHPAVGARSVSLELLCPDFDPKWQWPLRIGAFESDQAQFDLRGLGSIWPSEQLAVPLVLGRENARVEILVLAGGIRSALSRLLALPYRVRAGHLLLVTPPDSLEEHANELLRSLMSITQAGAVSLVSVPDNELGFRINGLVAALSHNIPYDMALGDAFSAHSAIHAMDLQLLQCTRMDDVLDEVAASLEELPETATLSLSRPDVVWYHTQVNPASPAAEMGRALKSMRSEIGYDSESHGARAISEIATAGREAWREVAIAEPSRHLQADLFRIEGAGLEQEHRGLVLGRRYRLEVMVAPPGAAAIVSDLSFDESQLDWSESHTQILQVMLSDPEQWKEPMTGTLVLPRNGSSSRCVFTFVPTSAGQLSGRITLYHRGRVLQTALLKCRIFHTEELMLSSPDTGDPAVVIRGESEIRRSLSTLDERRRFDVCLVLNHTSAERATATLAGKDGAYIASLDSVKPHLAAINSRLTDVAHDAGAYAKGLNTVANAELLCDLAKEGHWIRRSLVNDYLATSAAAEALHRAEYLQIVSTRPDDPVPLEFVYDYPPPKPGAKVCRNARKALQSGSCPMTCCPPSGQQVADHVCPMGFWGLSRVIERHVIDPNLPKPALVRSEPIGGRDLLSLNGSMLLAASKEVGIADRTVLEKSVKALWKRKGKVLSVKTWLQWAKAVGDEHPVMLLALPHSGGSGAAISLEISGDELESLYINASHVTHDPNSKPLVILFGCDTAGTADVSAYARHVTVFRQEGAALVIGTVATVLGADAAAVASTLVGQIVKTAGNSDERFGEVLRQAKRDAVRNSKMVALSLVAFGDADWRISKGV